MGRQPYADKKLTDKCPCLKITDLGKHNYLKGGVIYGSLSWGWQNHKISLVVSTVEGDEYCRFQYKCLNLITDELTNHDYKAKLASTPCNYGKRRWWFICPYVKNDKPCNRRVGALYFRNELFGCRECHNLAYKSTRENHDYDGLLRRIGLPPE